MGGDPRFEVPTPNCSAGTQFGFCRKLTWHILPKKVHLSADKIVLKTCEARYFRNNFLLQAGYTTWAVTPTS